MSYMSREFLTPLRRAGLVKNGEVVDRAFDSLSLSKLMDLYDEVTETSSITPSPVEMSGKLHCASISLSGGLTECSSISCRKGRADELARFSALYSDHVLFYNFLSDIAPSFGHVPDEDSDRLRYRMYADISILNSIAPLIEQGVLIPYSTPRAFCPSCYAHKYIGKSAGARFEKARTLLQKELLESMTVELVKKEDGYWALCSGEHEYFAHGEFSCWIGKDHSAIDDRPKIKKLLQDGSMVRASKSLRKDLNIHGQVVAGMLGGASYQMAVSKITGASFLTHSKQELSTLRRMAEDNDNRSINNIIENNWKTIVPFAEDVPLQSILLLKSREKEAFIKFRVALEKAVNEVNSSKSEFTVENARQFIRI